MKILFFILLFTLLVVAVKAQEQRREPSKNDSAPNKQEQQKMALVALKFTRDKSQYVVSIANVTLVDVAKNITKTPAKWNENDFVCFFRDESNQVIDTLVIEQPLKVRYEYPNEDGTIGSKTVELSENEVLLRFPYNKKIKYMYIGKAAEHRKVTPVTILMLPQTN